MLGKVKTQTLVNCFRKVGIIYEDNHISDTGDESSEHDLQQFIDLVRIDDPMGTTSYLNVDDNHNGFDDDTDIESGSETEDIAESEDEIETSISLEEAKQSILKLKYFSMHKCNEMLPEVYSLQAKIESYSFNQLKSKKQTKISDFYPIILLNEEK